MALKNEVKKSKNGCGDHFFFKISKKLFKSKCYEFTVHCKPLLAIISENRHSCLKLQMRVTTMAPMDTQPIRVQQPKLPTDYIPNTSEATLKI